MPEICKQSLTECPAKGGLELFVIGKNFLKDTRVIFQEEDADGRVLWEASSEPLKDYLQQVGYIIIKYYFSYFHACRIDLFQLCLLCVVSQNADTVVGAIYFDMC